MLIPGHNQKLYILATKDKLGVVEENVDTIGSLKTPGPFLNNAQSQNDNGVCVETNQPLQKLALELWQKPHCHFRPQQPYSEIMCTDQKTNCTLDNTKVVGPNMIGQQEVVCDNVHMSPGVNHEVRVKVSQVLQELAPGLSQKLHVRQQQPHSNSICSDQKTSSAPDNTKVVRPNMVCQQEMACDNMHISPSISHEASEKASQALKEIDAELWQSSHCHNKQQQPYSNIICSDKETNLAPDNTKAMGPNTVCQREIACDNVHISLGVNHINTNNSSPLHGIHKTNTKLDNVVVETILSNTLMGPNMHRRQEVACDNVYASAGTNCMNIKTSSPSYDVQKPNSGPDSAPGNVIVRSNVVHQQEVTCDNMYSSPDVNHVNVRISPPSYDVRKANSAPDNSVVRPISSNTEVEPNAVLQQEITCEYGLHPSPCVNSVNIIVPSLPYDVEKSKTAVHNASVGSSPSHNTQHVENAPKHCRVDKSTIAYKLCDRPSTVLPMTNFIPCSVLDGIPIPLLHEDGLQRILEEHAWGHGP